MSLGFLITDAMAQTAAAPATAGAPPATVDGVLMQFLPLFLIFGVFYFLLIRPQQKKYEQHKQMVEGIRRGDKVVTAGGILGTVVRADTGDEVLVEIAENVKVRVVKSTITAVNAKTEAVAETTPSAKTTSDSKDA
ncbi:MAG: preprotein translocase subunit YajC [Alphaproteobacteria bacterium]|nr:preprotein translocase subunit YajC [Alphaproteobacteria bacterium]